MSCRTARGAPHRATPSVEPSEVRAAPRKVVTSGPAGLHDERSRWSNHPSAGKVTAKM